MARQFGLCLAVVGVAVLLSGCGSNAGPEPAESEPLSIEGGQQAEQSPAPDENQVENQQDSFQPLEDAAAPQDSGPADLFGDGLSEPAAPTLPDHQDTAPEQTAPAAPEAGAQEGGSNQAVFRALGRALTKGFAEAAAEGPQPDEQEEN